MPFQPKPGRYGRREQVLRLREQVLSEGLPFSEDRAEMASLARILREKLQEESNPNRVVEAARIAADAFETSLEKNPPSRSIDCRKGCSFCCSRMVAVSAPEAFMVADALIATGRHPEEDIFLRARRR